jgi:hypothetical protein
MLPFMAAPRLSTPHWVLRGRHQQSTVTAMQRQDPSMGAGPKRERWSEADVDELPAGEHDYFERKSGRLFEATRARCLGPSPRRYRRSPIVAGVIWCLESRMMAQSTVCLASSSAAPRLGIG